MAQLGNGKVQITNLAGVNAGTFTPVVNPLLQARSVTVFNADLATDIEVATDPADALAVVTVPPGSSLALSVSDSILRGWILGEVVAYVRGGVGTSPKVKFEA